MSRGDWHVNSCPSSGNTHLISVIGHVTFFGVTQCELTELFQTYCLKRLFAVDIVAYSLISRLLLMKSTLLPICYAAEVGTSQYAAFCGARCEKGMFVFSHYD